MAGTFKEIQLPVHGICVTVYLDGSGTISSELGTGSDQSDKAIVDTIESLVLALACAGVDIASPEFVAGLSSGIESVSNKWF